MYIPDHIIGDIVQTIDKDQKKLKFKFCSHVVKLKMYYPLKCLHKCEYFIENIIIDKLENVSDIPEVHLNRIKKIHLEIRKDLDEYLSLLLKFKNLTSLRLGHYFNDSIDCLINLPNLKYLEFRYFFNQPIDVLKYLKRIVKLKFNVKFNQSLSSLSELKELKYLKLGCRDFSNSVEDIKLIENLKRLEISYRFKQNFKDSKFECDFFYY